MKSHSKLHDLNSPIDHRKVNGLFGVGTGMGFIVTGGDDSFKITAEPVLATDAVVELFDRLGGVTPLFSVTGEGTLIFNRMPAATDTRDIVGSLNGLVAPQWWINADGSAQFEGTVTINGGITGTGVIDTLDEILNLLFAPANPDRNKAYQRSLFMYSDASPGTLNSFSVDNAGAAVTVGAATAEFTLALYGIMTLNTGIPGGPAIEITNTSGSDILNTSGSWDVDYSGYATFAGLLSQPVLGVGALTLTTLAASGLASMTVNHDDATSPAIIINNTGATGNDITGTSSNWIVRPDGSATFKATAANVGMAVVGSATAANHLLTLTNAGTGSLLSAAQTGVVADAVVLNNIGATNAVINITNSAATYDVIGNSGNWYCLPNGDIYSLATGTPASSGIHAEQGSLFSPILNSGSTTTTLTLQAQSGNMTAQTLNDGEFVFELLNSLLPGKVVRPANDADTDLGRTGYAWKNIYGGALYAPYLYNVREIQGDGTNPLRIDSNTKALELETQGAGINVIDSGLTLNGNSLTLDNILQISHVSGSNLTLNVSKSAHDLILQATAAHGLLPSADNTLVIGSYTARFGTVYATNLKATTSIDSAVSGTYSNLVLTCGTGATATRMDFHTGTAGARFYLNGGSSLHPFDNLVNDLGGGSTRWQDIWLWGNIDGVKNLRGTSDAHLTFDSINGKNIQFNSDSNNILFSADNLINAGNIIPNDNLLQSLGTSLLQWLNIYTQKVTGMSGLILEANGSDLTLQTVVSGNVSITSVGTFTASGTTASLTSTTGAVTLTSAAGISLNPGTPNEIDCNGADLINVGVIDGIDFSNSFCTTLGIVTGLKNDVVTLDCDQAIAGNVTLRFGATNLKDITYDVGSTQFIVGGNIKITGNLTVDGTQTIVNSTTVEIKDNVILLNKGGIFPGTNRAGILIDRGGTDRSSLLWDETADRWICGPGDDSTPIVPGSLEEIITTNLSQTLVNKLVTLGKNGAVSPFAGVLTLCDGLNPGSTVTLDYPKWNALDALGTGIMVKTTGGATPAYSPRSIVTSGSGINAVSNADGTGGNPTISLNIGTGATQVAAGNHTHPASQRMMYSFTGTDTPYVRAGSDNNWKAVANIIFPGSTAIGSPTAITVVISNTNAGGGCDWQVVDITNASNVIASGGNVATGLTPTIDTDSSLTNIPAAQAIWELQLMRNPAGTGRAAAHSMEVTF